MEEYRKSILEYQDVRDAVDYAKELAREEGIKEGQRIGLEKAKIQLVQKCREEGLSIDLISKLTGLSIEQIGNIK